MKKYLSVAELSNETADEFVKATMKILLSAENYTDAEASTIEFWEERYKEKFPNIEVSKINVEKYSRAVILSDADLDELKVFKVMVNLSYDGGKYHKKIIYALDETMASLVDNLEKYIQEKYQPVYFDLIKAEEVDILPISPEFEKIKQKQDEDEEN